MCIKQKKIQKGRKIASVSDSEKKNRKSNNCFQRKDFFLAKHDIELVLLVVIYINDIKKNTKRQINTLS